MRIISPWADYYDNRQCYANPTHCSNDFIYTRKTSVLTIPKAKLNFVAEEYSDENKRTIKRHIVGFCGEWYFIYAIKTSNKYYNSENKYKNYTFFSHIKDALIYNWHMKYINKCFKSNNFELGSIFKKYKKATLDQTIDKVLDVCTKYEKRTLNEFSLYLNSLNLFERNNTPALEVKYLSTINTQKEASLIVNPSLEKLSFYKVMRGEIAYMNIEMFLGNELLPKDNPDQITDNKIKIQNHGFDLKTSFRKAPGSKKRKRKKHEKL